MAVSLIGVSNLVAGKTAETSKIFALNQKEESEMIEVGDKVFVYVAESEDGKGSDVGEGEVIQVDDDKVQVTWLADIYRKGWFCTHNLASESVPELRIRVVVDKK